MSHDIPIGASVWGRYRAHGRVCAVLVLDVYNDFRETVVNNTPKTHELKTDPEPFMDVWKCVKTFEVRKNDRNFQVGDTLVLKQTVHSAHDMATKDLPLQYTGRQFVCSVVYILSGYGLQEGYVILGIDYD
jgi:hypothetical protein